LLYREILEGGVAGCAIPEEPMLRAMVIAIHLPRGMAGWASSADKRPTARRCRVVVDPNVLGFEGLQGTYRLVTAV